MKNGGPFILTTIIAIAIIMTLYQDGKLFTSTKKTNSKTSSSQSTKGEVLGAQTTNFGAVSPYKNYVGIIGIKNPGTFAGSEYITIKSSFRDPIVFTGWTITSDTTGNKAVIGTASPFPEILPVQTMILKKGDKVILSSGKSPMSFSFRTNLCTGYYEEKYLFTPTLPLQCPLPENEDFLPKKVEDNDECMDYLHSFSRCELPPKKLPNLPSYCKAYIEKTMSYGACVGLHVEDKDFYKPEWRLFLNSKFPYWYKEKDTLRLWDAQGRLVDVYSYDF